MLITVRLWRTQGAGVSTDASNPTINLKVERSARGAIAAGCALLVLASAAVTGAGPAKAQGIPLIRDSEIERLLNDYAQPIFRVAGLGSQRIRIRIVRSRIFNAFVLDGRNVFVHTGALFQAETPNELIGVIAHETGHIAGGHMAALRARIQQDQSRLLLMRILGIGAAIATGNPAAMVAGDQLVLRSLLAERRSQEGAADQAGLSYLTATRQSGRGMLKTFERFRQQEFLSAEQQDPFVRSHPVAGNRLARLRRLVERSPYFNAKDSKQLQLRHDLMRAKLAGYLQSPAEVFNRYPRSDNSIPAQYARAIASYFRGGANGLRNALAGADRLIRAMPNYAYFWEFKADILKRAGRATEAVPLLRKAISLAPKSPLMKVELASALIQTKSPKAVAEAVKLLRQSLVADPSSRGFRFLANAYYLQGKRAEADASIAQANFQIGKIKSAKIFARRAQAKLRRGSPLWVKMDDIIKYQ